MRHTVSGLIFAVLACLAAPVAAQGCGGSYTVKRGESLSLIADRLYKNAGMWTAIHANNLAAIGEDPDRIHAGMRLWLGCIDGRPEGLDGGVTLSNVAATSAALTVEPGTAATRSRINLMTASDYAPFTDRDLPNGGILADVVNAAMRQADPPQGYAIHWVEGWGSHLEPLLSNALLDMGFPWIRPDCESTPEEYRCANFLFSDPMFEMLMILFVSSAAPMRYDEDADMRGRTLCRPAGYATHQLDRPDRRWLSEGQVVLKQPVAVADCFAMLVAGEVDGVVLNEFTGRAAIRDLGLKDKVQVAPRPLAIEGLHVLVHKTHPDADALLTMINEGLRAIKQNGVYQHIIDTHMTRVWAEF